jgi:hypothetical protein
MKDYLPLSDDDFEYEDVLLENDGAVLLDCPNEATALAYERRFHDTDLTVRTEVEPVLSDDHHESLGAHLFVEYLQFDDEHGWFGSDRPDGPNERAAVDATKL